MLQVRTRWSTAEIYLLGAHVTHFASHGQPPLLFMSQCSRFSPEQPIRGGVPIIFPWFGPREGLPQHGFARLKEWQVKEFSPAADGSVSVRFCLPECPEASAFPPFSADYVVTVGESLSLNLIVTNQSKDESFTFEDCLHTYFEVGDITAVSITGLEGGKYLDKVASYAEKTESNDAIHFNSEVDRIYLNTTGPIEITDPRRSRKIRVQKKGSLSTVLWNPWQARAQQMPDFGNDEFQRMVCVECGNVGPNQVSLPPGESSHLEVNISAKHLA